MYHYTGKFARTIQEAFGPINSKDCDLIQSLFINKKSIYQQKSKLKSLLSLFSMLKRG